MFFENEYIVIDQQRQSAVSQIAIARNRTEAHSLRIRTAEIDINCEERLASEYKNEIEKHQSGALGRNDTVSSIVSTAALRDMKFTVIANTNASLCQKLYEEEQLLRFLEASCLEESEGEEEQEQGTSSQTNQADDLSIADKMLVDSLSRLRDVEEFDRFLMQIQDYNVQASGGRTILINSVINKFDYAVYKLLQMKVDVNICDDTGTNALIYSATAGNENIILCLSKLTKYIDTKGINGNTVLHQLVVHCRQSLFTDNISDDLEEAEEEVIICKESGNLYKVLQEKTFYLIQDLYKAGANLNILNDENFSPPLLASAMNLGHLCKLIFEKFYLYITFNHPNHGDKGYIHWAKEHNNVEQLKFFYNHKDEVRLSGGDYQLLEDAFLEEKHE
jgi:ankyrin repeat protein